MSFGVVHSGMSKKRRRQGCLARFGCRVVEDAALSAAGDSESPRRLPGI